MSKRKLPDSPAICQQILDHYHQVKTLQELAAHIKWTSTLTDLRQLCYRLGLKRIELQRWTSEQVQYLRQHYQSVGDKELAQQFTERWPKAKGWSLKHIEKKRMYLKLKRTPAELRRIHQRNVANGCFALGPVKRWQKTGVTPPGTIHFWCHGKRKFPVIKLKEGFQPWNRWAWEATYGLVPPGMNVIFKDGDPQNMSIENLALLDNAALAAHNAKHSSTALSDNYVAGILGRGNQALTRTLKRCPQLINLKRTQLILNRSIYENSNT